MRDATPDDVPAIRGVARSSWLATYGDVYARAFIDDFLERAYSRDSLERSIARAASGVDAHFLVAERAGEVVGYLHFGEGESGPELYRLYARPDQFGTGIGQALLDELESRIRQRVSRYILYVHERNPRGRRFYERRGFTEVGRREGSNDELMLEKVLRGS